MNILRDRSGTMYNFEIKPTLEKKLFKIKKKDKKTFKRIADKIKEIIIEPHHYKPLKVPMQNIRRVHIGSYVLTFEINEGESLVEFIDYDHHDKVYRKSR